MTLLIILDTSRLNIVKTNGESRLTKIGSLLDFPFWFNMLVCAIIIKINTILIQILFQKFEFYSLFSGNLAL